MQPSQLWSPDSVGGKDIYRYNFLWPMKILPFYGERTDSKMLLLAPGPTASDGSEYLNLGSGVKPSSLWARQTLWTVTTENKLFLCKIPFSILNSQHAEVILATIS